MKGDLPAHEVITDVELNVTSLTNKATPAPGTQRPDHLAASLGIAACVQSAFRASTTGQLPDLLDRIICPRIQGNVGSHALCMPTPLLR